MKTKNTYSKFLNNLFLSLIYTMFLLSKLEVAKIHITMEVKNTPASSHFVYHYIIISRRQVDIQLKV